MRWVEAFVVVLVGFAVRLAIPIMLTALTVYLLQRLDEQWQEEAMIQVKTADAAPWPRCWAIKGCTPGQIEQCPAGADERPCWQVFRALNNGYLKDECLTCDVFLQTPILIAT